MTSDFNVEPWRSSTSVWILINILNTYTGSGSVLGSAYKTVNAIVSVANLIELMICWSTVSNIIQQAEFKSDDLNAPEASYKLHLHKGRKNLPRGWGDY